MISDPQQQATSTELAGGTGFSYEDMVVAYYLAALLREERAGGQSGVVKSVAVQQRGHDHPMDDIVVEFHDEGVERRLSLQAKRHIRISAAASNTDFREIILAAVETRTTPDFQVGSDAYGFVVENVAVEPFRNLARLIEWAKASPTGTHFERRFADGGTAAAAERQLRTEIASLINTTSVEAEADFYRHLSALRLDGLSEGGILRTEVVNRLQELVAVNQDGQDLLLFDRLCRLAREAAGVARKWTRHTLLNQLRGLVQLKVALNYATDVDLLQSLSVSGMADISEHVSGFRVDRPGLQKLVADRLAECRLVNISGLPGCGKSAVLKSIASDKAAEGPIFFLKSDRLNGTSWLTFAASLGLRHRLVADLLAEIGSAGTPILFIDGIDRIKPDQRGLIADILRAIESDEQLANWKILASSRDQGLEAYRAWFPSSFYRVGGIGDVAVKPFSDAEAEDLAQERPILRRLLFGAPSVKEIARRPFFAAVLARTFPDNAATPQTEVGLIAAWWSRAGHDAPAETIPQRQRALLDLAERGVRNLGKNISARALRDSTFAQITALKGDFVIRDHDSGASFSFVHDIFFEWVFFRLLIELGKDWTRCLTEAGQPPLLGRVVGLLAQNALASPGKWSAGYRILEDPALRPQWRREWLTAPPFSPTFVLPEQEFQTLLFQDDYALLGKLLVWFQAQHTVPSPIILQHAQSVVEGADRLRMADLLGWPSDFQSWGRLISWLLSVATEIPIRLLPNVLGIFDVWQNALTDLKNPLSEAIIDACNRWLLDLESVEYPEKLSFEHGRWEGLSSEARSSLASGFRTTILRAARAYPEPAIALFERATTSNRMRQYVYSDLMTFAPIMSEVAPEKVVILAKVELIEELPQDTIARVDREDREHMTWLQRIRAIPEKDRTKDQRRALEHPHFPLGRSTVQFDDIGINKNEQFYFPVSPLHEPFASLFAKRPDVALGLVRDLANHATAGWRQVQTLQPGAGTPLPVTLDFPWGKQDFWGDWHVYNWFLGQLAPNPLECAFLALSYWAFSQIESGRPTDDIIRAVVEGNECYAVLGLALVLALETYHASDVTLPIASCQRLWSHDIARVAQEPARNIDLFGIGALTRLTGQKAKAQEYLDRRQSRSRNVRELAMHFAVGSDNNLQKRFKEALARFPDDLPYEVEEARRHTKVTAALREAAEGWAGLGDIKNYRRHDVAEDQVFVSYQPPVPRTPEQEKRLESSAAVLQEFSVIGWASKSLAQNELADGIGLDSAIAFARSRDGDGVFAQLEDVGDNTPQSAISAVAACVIRFGPSSGDELDWAWNVMDRIGSMRQRDDVYPGSKMPWHPAIHLVVALRHDRHSLSPRQDSAQRLFKLTAHPLEDVSHLAFAALLRDPHDHVCWIAGQLAINYSLYHQIEINHRGERNNRRGREWSEKSLSTALHRLGVKENTPFHPLPAAWVQSKRRPRYSRSAARLEWGYPDPSFNPQLAAKIFLHFPVEAWCRSATFRPMFVLTLRQFVAWTAERLKPSWLDRKGRSEHKSTDLFEWNRCLADLLARAAPFFDTEFVKREFLAPFLTDDEEGLPVIAEFADMTVRRHVFDATVIPTNTFDLLDACADRMIRHGAFAPHSWRAGEVHGYDLPKLITALFFVGAGPAPAAARFANGDWSQIDLLMPLVTKLLSATGWSSFVMQNFLTLCERAGLAYPLDTFAAQSNAVLAVVDRAKGSWTGTLLPARIAAIVQRLSDGNFPLRDTQAQELLKVLDALIDLGDRRSAALEQSEAFRAVQGLMMETNIPKPSMFAQSGAVG